MESVAFRTPASCRPVLAAGVAAAALLALVTLPAFATAAGLSDSAPDQVKASTPVPDAVRKLGEVRLLARGEAVVVQTLLQTKLLSRVVAEIRVKDGRNWPQDDEGSSAYLAALEAARDTLEKREIPFSAKDRRRRLLIEFAADEKEAVVLLGSFRFTGQEAPTQAAPALPEREILATVALPRAYILRNIRLILADSFKLPESEVDGLGPLGPASRGAVP
ncbi:MAG: hypothetical protein ABR538_05550 [Candidatus Binatia bacterium]